MVGITHYLEQGGHAGIGLSEVPGRIVFDGIEAGYSRCPQYDIAYRYTEAGVVEKIGGRALPSNANKRAADREALRSRHPIALGRDEGSALRSAAGEGR